MTELNTLNSKSTSESVLDKKNSIVLLHGTFNEGFFAKLNNQNLTQAFVMEGRPSLAASKTTSKQLLQHSIDPVLISDNMAGFLFYKGLVKEVWIAYQEVNEDGALCPVGALILGVLGKKHAVPVYLYPSEGKLEFLGQAEELMSFENKRIAPAGTKGYVPLMEWLPNKYFTEQFK